MPGRQRRDTIALEAGVYPLSIPGADEDVGWTGDLDVANALSIIGLGSELTFIDGGGLDRVLDLRLSGRVVISGVTIMGGGNVDSGGGIQSHAGVDLELNHTHVRDNEVTGDGGGLHVFDTLTLRDSAIYSNTAQHHGGGMLVNAATTVMAINTESTVWPSAPSLAAALCIHARR